ncbi:MAG: flagellar hook-basal body complex protein [Candidatus Latescibacterota bacterium]
MIDSIFIGITGVRSHQTRLNVISNNVANINTTAYKSGRASFSDVMSMTLAEGTPASEGTAATNPRQSGLGVEVGSIDTIQTQGTLQTTGVDTDMALEGEGFFVLGDANHRSFTRDGTFDFDVDGELFDPATGLVVQGHLARADGTFGSEVEDIVIPLDRESEAQASTLVRLSGNLNASGAGEGGPVWDTETRFGQPARLVSSPNPGFPLNLADLSGAGLKITVTEGGQVYESTISLPSKSFAQRTDLVAELNSLINANGTLKSRVLFAGNELGQLILRTVGGGQDVAVSVDNANPSANVASRLGFATLTRQTGARAADTDALNTLANVGEVLTDGDVLRFSGVKPDGERFDGSFTYAAGTAYTLEHLFTVLENVYGGVQAGVDRETGQLKLTDAVSGDRVVGFDLAFSLLDTGNGSGIFGGSPPYEYGTNAQVYDEKGNAHSLTITFTRGVVDNEWSWTATVDGLTPQAGNNGKVVFNEDGTLRTFESADRSDLLFTPAGGTPPLSISLEAASSERLGGLTQFVASSSASVREQDGRASGRLASLQVDASGTIVGLFSNGTSEALARLALASFSNPGGLRREGDNLLTQTLASGTAQIGTAGSTVQAAVRSGAIEMSNVDLAQEFTDMIVTQRGFQANARSITTSDELLTEVVNLKR